MWTHIYCGIVLGGKGSHHLVNEGAQLNPNHIAVFTQYLFFPMVKLTHTGLGYCMKTYYYYQGDPSHRYAFTFQN